jgi:hypothetical protein
VLQPVVPLTIIHLAIGPLVDAFAMRFARLERAKVGVVVWISLEAATLSQIMDPFSFVLAATTLLISHDAESLPHLITF